MSLFDITFDRLMKSEGGYVFDKNDPGGETNWGISKRSYPNVNIKKLTKEGAKAIYKKDFWDVIRADILPAPVAFQVADFAVNSGISTAIRYLQRVANVADDGHWGPVSKLALEAMSATDIIFLLNAERLDFMRRLAGWKFYSSGWAGRIANNLRYGASDS